MSIDWAAFLAVFLVSVGSTIVVVVLFSVALVEISARHEPEEAKKPPAMDPTPDGRNGSAGRGGLARQSFE